MPTAAFGYGPAIDYCKHIGAAGSQGMTPSELDLHLEAIGWRRPRGGEPSAKLMRTEMVSLCRYGFLERIEG
jgi:hypothetical protein